MTNICIECGLCCDGTVFRHATVEPDDDLGPILAKGAVLTRKRDFFLLPCPALESKCCTIYDDTRPTVCGAFKCKLLQRYESEEVELESARKVIATVSDLRDRLRAVVDPGHEQSEETRTDLTSLTAKYLEKPADETDDAERHAVMLDTAALNMMLAQHFERDSPTDKQPAAETSVDSQPRP